MKCKALIGLALLASAGHSAQAASPTTKPTCPATFTEFVNRFEADRHFQKAYTSSPLRITSVDVMSDPVPQEVVHVYHDNAIPFPLVPTRAEQHEKGLNRTITPPDRNTYIVKYAVPDTGYQLSYIFTRMPHCWILLQKNDESI